MKSAGDAGGKARRARSWGSCTHRSLLLCCCFLAIFPPGASPEAGEGLGSELCDLGWVTPPLCAAPFPTARQGPGERRVHLSDARYLKTDFKFLVLHAKHPASSLIPQVRSCQRSWLLAPVPAVCAQAVEASELHPARQTRLLSTLSRNDSCTAALFNCQLPGFYLFSFLPQCYI